jgi:hypothetical protein
MKWWKKTSEELDVKHTEGTVKKKKKKNRNGNECKKKEGIDDFNTGNFVGK